jgi:hypothetical protein
MLRYLRKEHRRRAYVLFLCTAITVRVIAVDGISAVIPVQTLPEMQKVCTFALIAIA